MCCGSASIEEEEVRRTFEEELLKITKV